MKMVKLLSRKWGGVVECIDYVDLILLKEL